METQSVEDINAVLGRFQSWTGSRNAVEPRPGVRELSYEEALESGRYKWKGADKARAGKVKDAEVEPETVSPKKCVSKRGAERKAGGKENVTKRVAVAKTAAKPGFREVLVETVRRSEIVAPVKQAEVARQTAISIRFAPEERALIKKRAAEAGISASAYIRQCALEVEQLRAQVREAIAAMERGFRFPFGVRSPRQAFFRGLRGRFFRGVHLRSRCEREFFAAPSCPRRSDVMGLRLKEDSREHLANPNDAHAEFKNHG